MRYTEITEKKLKWINKFYDTIYDYYCSGHNTVFLWNLQHELKFLRYIKNNGEYTFDEADKLNSIKTLYQYIKQHEN